MELPDDEVLDDPIWGALTGAQAGFAMTRGRAASYLPEVAPFAAVADDADPAAWADLAELVALAVAGVPVAVIRTVAAAPPGWTLVVDIPGVQMVGTGPLIAQASGDIETVRLGPDDATAVHALVELTDPGPFRARTMELGGYRGIRAGTDLVAMAGQRMHPPGWTEISAVCTHPDHRGRGLARRLVQELRTEIERGGERACLHVMASNTRAIALYAALGFVARRDVHFVVMAPDA